VIRDKLYHVERYKQFAEEAEKDGDSNAASLFKALGADSKRHVTELETRAGSV
jgi:rubrerythrin